MTEVIRHGETCEVKQVSSGRTVVAEIMSFNDKRNLTVVMNKSVKMNMAWNGRTYEGRMAGMDFISTGPTISKTTTGVRG
jgi:hypothetical protein